MKKVLALGFLAAGLVSAAQGFELKSRDVRPGERLNEAQVFSGFGCSGGNLSPDLAWSDAPAGTKSFALTVYDPDAPTGSGWWHWVVYDIPAGVTALPSGIGKQASLPINAKQGRNDYGTNNFGGACPPPGDKPHRYLFTLHALKLEKLEVPADASAALVGYMINANRLDKATLSATYGR